MHENMKVIRNVASTTFRPKRGEEQINFGHSVGPGGRAFMYVSAQKEEEEEENKPTMIRSKFDFRRTQTNLLQKWNNYDSNMSNTIVEQRKILRGKNYELDSRAWAVKDLGMLPKL